MKNLKKSLRYSLYLLLCICLFSCNKTTTEPSTLEEMMDYDTRKMHDLIIANSPQHLEYRNINNTITITTSDGVALTDKEKDFVRILMDIDSLDIYWIVRNK